ncbi:MAG: LEA type 2 family protein [Spirochaetota bacterium]
MRRIVPVVLLAAGFALLSGCETLRSLFPSVERPTARVESASLTRLTFSDAEITTRIVVENPNAVSVTLTGFAYALDVEGVELLSGHQSEGLKIEAFGTSRIDLPLQVGFRNLRDTLEAMRGRDEASYAVEVDLQFELLALGAVTIPVRREGTLPVVRPPSVRVVGLALDSMGITAAELSLTVGIENPNVFAFTLESLDYAFAVDGRLWADGATDRPRRVPAGGSGNVTVDIRIGFAAFGRTVRDLLLGDEDIPYSFVSRARIDPEIDLMPTVSLPFEREGTIPLRRP